MPDETKQLLVVDSSVTADSGPRSHDIFVNGELQVVTFEHGKDKYLPEEVAMKFMLPGFTVVEGGREVSVPVADGVKLASDEVIARLAELTIDALRIRAAVKPGGEHFLSCEDRKELEKFLKGIVTIDGEENLIDETGEEFEDEEFDREPATGEQEIPAEAPAPAAFDVNGVDTTETDEISDEEKAKIAEYDALVAQGMSDYEARETVWPGSEDTKTATEEGKA